MVCLFERSPRFESCVNIKTGIQNHWCDPFRTALGAKSAWVPKGKVEENLRRMGVGIDSAARRGRAICPPRLSMILKIFKCWLRKSERHRHLASPPFFLFPPPSPPWNAASVLKDLDLLAISSVSNQGISVTTRVKLDHQHDPYLQDHIYSGTCLFPAVFGMEAMAQVAACLMPEQPTVIRIQNVDRRGLSSSLKKVPLRLRFMPWLQR